MKKKIFRCWDKGNNKIGYVYRDKVTGNVNLGEEYFESWFYVFTADYEKHKSEFNKHIDEKVLIRVVPEGLYSRVYYNNSHISESLDRDMQFNWEYRTYTLKNMLDRFKMLSIQTFEADLKPWRRWMISDDVEIEDTYKIAYYDIETDDRHPDGLDNIGKYRILSIAVKMSDTNHSDGKMYWFCLEEDTDEAERKMLLKFANIIRYTDVLISFNGINFDDIYIKARMLRYGISIDWRKKILQDHCWTYKKYAPGQQSYSLESISQTVLGRGKVDHSSYKIYDMWRKNRALLKEYNIEDVQLMYDIEEKTKFLSVHRDVCKEGSFPVDDLYISRKIDNLILKQAERDMFYHFKTKEFDEEEINEGIGYTGAFVFDPVIGRHVNIRVFDFKSLYPNVMVTFNISPDTLITREFIEANPHIPYITTPNGQFFRKDFIGILPKVVKMFTDKRNYYKDLMAKEVPGTMLHKLYDRLQYVYKYYGLSFYGCTGEKNSRMFDVRVAESITLTGQYFTKTVAKYVENNGMGVTYGDSISGERNTIIKRNGMIEVMSFKELYELADVKLSDRGKDFGKFDEPVYTLSYNFILGRSEWKELQNIIRHKTDKPLYLYRYRDGVTKITADHSLIDSNGKCFKPTEHFRAFSIPALHSDKTLKEFDLQDYIKPYEYYSKKSIRRNAIVFKDGYISLEKYTSDYFLTKVDDTNIHSLIRLCAHYIGNGSSSTMETTSRFMLSIANKNIGLLNILKDDLSKFFPESTIVIRKSDDDGNYKICIGTAVAAIVFKQLCGQRYNGKKIPHFIYNISSELQDLFIEEMMKADGYVEYLKDGSYVYDYESASCDVISGLTYLMKLREYITTVQCNYDDETFTVRNRQTQNGYEWLVKNLLIEESSTDYVYDLTVADNNNFVDAMGNVLLHNTDSAFLSGLEEHHVPQLMVKLKQLCDHHAKKFGCDICTIEMDYDKGFKTFLAIAKKRYAGVIDYLDGHKIDDFNMYIAGLEYKRTDTLSIVKKWQYDLLKVILEHSEAPAIQQIMDMLVEYKNIVYGNKLTEEDVLLSKRLTKPAEEYVGRQMHVMVTKQMREDNLAVYVGDKIGYFIRSLDNNRKPVPEPIHRYEGIYHADYYWNNLIYPPLKRVVEVAYPSFDWEYLLEKKTASKIHVTRGRVLW